ncbi:MAG TPA: hypothetical protein VGI81_15325, partial [Tepidisphaeraceae bacterium]|jgi:hypothetical protein
MEPTTRSISVSSRLALAMLGLMTCIAGCQPNHPVGSASFNHPTTTPAERHQLEGAKDLFYQSVSGDRPALPRAQQILEELGGGDSADPQVIAYTGAAELLQASRSPNFFEKAALGRQGMDMEDRAVAAAPDDLEVRFLRGVTYYQLPPFLGRREMAVNDLTRVARVAESAAKAGRLDPRAAAADLCYYGKAREDACDAPGAIAAWRAAVRVDADSPGGRDAIKHLAEHNASL